MENKFCPRCKQDVPLKGFTPLKSGKTASYCKPCMLEYKKARYKLDPSKAIKAATAYAAANKDKVKEYQDAYRGIHRSRLNADAVVYRMENADAIREKDKARGQTPARRENLRTRWHERYHNDVDFNKAVRASGKKAHQAWYNRNRKSILAAIKDARPDNLEAIREATRLSVLKWRRAHPDTVRANQSERNAMRRGATVVDFCQKTHIAHLLIWQNGLCYHCNAPLIGPTGKPKFDVEHVVPIARGGLHCATNTVLACTPCNSSKGPKLLNVDWVRRPLPAPQRLVWADQVEATLGPDAPLKIISTFFASERNGAHGAAEMLALRAEFPDDILAFDWEWMKKREALRNMVASRRGSAARVAARATTVQEVDTDNARAFFDRFHLQGFGRGATYLGLVHDGEIVGLSAWMLTEGVAELNRLAFKGSVPGGFSRLLRHFSDSFLIPGTPITSFVDPRYAKGTSYEQVGFEYAGETDQPIYYYVNGNGMHHRRGFMKGNLEARLPYFNGALSERDNAAANGYYRVFGLRQKRYLLNQKSAD